MKKNTTQNYEFEIGGAAKEVGFVARRHGFESYLGVNLIINLFNLRNVSRTMSLAEMEYCMFF